MVNKEPRGRQPDRSVPLFLWVDPTNACNLSCAYCYTKHSHGSVHLAVPSFHRLIDWLEPVRPQIKVLHLNWLGEPLMNPHFEELLQVHGERVYDIPMHWHTNGTLLTKNRARKIVAASRPHRVFVSIDGGTTATHEKNRGVGTFRRSVVGLRNLLEANEEAGRPLSVGVYQIEFGVPRRDYDPEFAELASRASEWIRVVPLEGDGAEGGAPQACDSACFWAGHALCIDSSGRVAVCVISRGANGTIGHLDRDSVFDVIRRSGEWRAALIREGRQSQSHCSACRKKNGSPFVDRIEEVA